MSPRKKKRPTSRLPGVTGDPRVAALRARVTAGESLAGLELTGIRLTDDEFGNGQDLDFSGCDLRGAQFENINLSGARFVDADLCGARVMGATLSGADFRRCAARGALFSDVNLAYASFAESDLCGAILYKANMADISFKGATLDGAEIDAIRLTLNGSTHVLGLKETLRALAGESSYPYIAGVSGDCFWVTYYVRTRDLNWGGLAKDALRRGLDNFGFPCAFVDEVDESDAWDALRQALADGNTVITPLHVSKSTILGCGFGGSEWVFVTGIDRGDVLVNSLLGDRVRFSRERFLEGWCMPHPLEEAAADLPIIYAMCVVQPRERTPSKNEITYAGLQAAVEIMTLPSTDKVAFGFDSYTCMEEDLTQAKDPADLPPEELRRFLPWSGFGLLHHHGSRWAIRDFLDEVLRRGELPRSDEVALREARELYDDVWTGLQWVLQALPWTFDTETPAEREEAIRTFRQNREEAIDRLRSAAARERDALERFRAVVEAS